MSDIQNRWYQSLTDSLLNNIIIIICIFLTIFGSLIGSFINVVISRLPEKGKFLSDSRSHCPVCKQVIRWYDLFPVISWIFLLGKCRDCKANISVRYPLIELTGAISAIACFWRFGFEYQAIIVFAMTMILLAIALIDFDTSEIPDSLNIAIVPFAIASIWFIPNITLLSHFIGLFTISLPMLLLTMAIPGAFGGGDIKLMAVCGFLLGWQQSLLSFFIALLIGGSIAVYLMLSGKRKRGEHMVFGPALCVGVTVSMYFGKEIIDLYLQFLLF